VASRIEYHEPPVPAFLFDLDGTLIDSVYQNVIAWRNALSKLSIDLSVWRIHRRIGMSGGLFVSALLRETGCTLSQADIESLIADGIRVRLCKGAYKEPSEVAFPKKSDVDLNYIKLADVLLQSPLYHGLATHDEAMIAAAKAFAAQRGIDRNHFEFQMLFGVRRDLQRKLVAEGYNVRVYIPFGREWYPYFMRRLAERPANVFFIAKQMFRQ